MIEQLVELDGFEKELMGLFVAVANAEMKSDTPMSEMRERHMAAGRLYGRCIAVCLREEIGADELMMIRGFEEEYRQRFAKACSELLGPDGEVRKMINDG